MEGQRGLRERAFLRRLVEWAANNAPLWFVRSAPVALGIVFALVLGSERRAVRRNLRRIFKRRGALEEWRDIFSTFCQFAACFTESLAPDRALFRAREFEISGQHLVDPIRQQGRGILFLTAHVGPWDTSAMGLQTFSDGPVMMLMAPERDNEAGQVHDRLRGAAMVTVLRIGHSSLDALPALTHLRSGGIVVAQMDRVQPGRDGIESELFEEPFLVPRGLFRLAGVAGVPVVPVFSARLGFGRRLVQVSAPIEVPRRPSEQELRDRAGWALASLALHLRTYPTQWFNFVDEGGRSSSDHRSGLR